jgi:hypothetical protein
MGLTGGVAPVDYSCDKREMHGRLGNECQKDMDSNWA